MPLNACLDPAYTLKMIQVLASESLTGALPDIPQIIGQIGIGNKRIMGRQGALLALATHCLMKQAGMAGPLGEAAGTYCAIDTNLPDDLLRLENASPMQNLRDLPVSRAFWSSAVSGAEGPLRIFSQCSVAFSLAKDQAIIDLSDGICEFAFVLSVESNPESVTGVLLGKGPLNL